MKKLMLTGEFPPRKDHRPPVAQPVCLGWVLVMLTSFCLGVGMIYFQARLDGKKYEFPYVFDIITDKHPLWGKPLYWYLFLAYIVATPVFCAHIMVLTIMFHLADPAFLPPGIQLPTRSSYVLNSRKVGKQSLMDDRG